MNEEADVGFEKKRRYCAVYVSMPKPSRGRVCDVSERIHSHLLENVLASRHCVLILDFLSLFQSYLCIADDIYVI